MLISLVDEWKSLFDCTTLLVLKIFEPLTMINDEGVDYLISNFLISLDICVGI